MTQQQNKKSAPKSSPNLNKVDPQFLKVYDRTTCQKCNIMISRVRLNDCKKRRFWPVCVRCEKAIIPLYKEAMIKMAKIQEGFS